MRAEEFFNCFLSPTQDPRIPSVTKRGEIQASVIERNDHGFETAGRAVS